MKKILALLFSTLFLLNICCGCSGGKKQNETDSNKIQLTEENYKDYLNVEVKTYKVDNSGNIVYNFSSGYKTTSVTVKGTSSNFIYHDVSVTVDINVVIWKNKKYKNETVSMTVDCDVAGNGSDLQTVGYYTQDTLETDKCSYSIVNLTGYVERA